MTNEELIKAAEEVARAGRARLERQKDRALVIRACVTAMCETNEPRVRAEACGLLRGMRAISPKHYRNLMRG